MNPNSVNVTLTLIQQPIFVHDTLAYNVSQYWVWLKKVQQFISSKLTLIEMFNFGCVIDLGHSNPIFLLDTSLFIKLSVIAKDSLV